MKKGNVDHRLVTSVATTLLARSRSKLDRSVCSRFASTMIPKRSTSAARSVVKPSIFEGRYTTKPGNNHYLEEDR